MKFFNIDCHISVIEDLKNIFRECEHEVDSVLLSGHAWVFGKPSMTMDVVSSTNWRHIDQKMCDDFYERYKHSFEDYDGFIVTYPPVFSMLFEKFNKPIIMMVPIRYEVPFSGKPDKWLWFNSFLQRTIDSGQIIPVANSLYDKRYCEYFLDREFHYIPNLCNYTQVKYEPTKEQHLLESKALNLSHPKIVNKQSLGRYSWQQLTEYKSIINIPYNCSTMSMFEHYTSNIPTFVPSQEFLLDLCLDKHLPGIMSEVTWNQVENLKPGSSIFANNPSRKNSDPNEYDSKETMRDWFSLSDFFSEDMKHLCTFSSLEDLEKKLQTTDFKKVSSEMNIHNIERVRYTFNMWKQILGKIK